MIETRSLHLSGLGFALVLAVGCSGSGNPSAPTSTQSGPPVVTTYVGVVGVSVNSERSGSLSLTTSIPTTVSGGTNQPAPTGSVTGTLKTLDNRTVSLTGTVTTAGTRISVSGGGYQFDIAPNADGVLVGTGSLTVSATGTLAAPLPSLAGLRIGPQALTSGTSPLVASAATSTTSSASQSFCGSYLGTYFNPFKSETETGWITFVMNGVWSGAPTNYKLYGSAPQSGEHAGPDVVAFNGAATLSSASVPSRILDGNMSADVQGASINLHGDWLSDHWYGVYSGTDPKSIRSQGTWAAWPC